MEIPQINIDSFDYPLQSERIAKYPLENRDQSKLLVYKKEVITSTIFNNIADYLPENTLLVFNNTKVIRARLHFYKSTGARIEIFCLEPHFPSNAEEAFLETKHVKWHCLVGNQKKWKEDCISRQITVDGKNITVNAEMSEKLSDGVIIEFTWDGSVTFASIIETMGQTPIPPYLERESEDIDEERYQTVYSKYNGSVAAPTAGLHFSPEVFTSLKYKGIKTIELTLHVGAGTFKPVKCKTIGEHEMHTEHFLVPLETIKIIRNHKGPIIAVGTTTVRTLESLYLSGVKMLREKQFNNISQWDGFEYASEISVNESLACIENHLIKNRLNIFEASTSIIIVPGYKFKIIKGLITNFHQPRSTLLLLITALVGEKWHDIYHYALNNNYRFLSYGDSSLLLSDTIN